MDKFLEVDNPTEDRDPSTIILTEITGDKETTEVIPIENQN